MKRIEKLAGEYAKERLGIAYCMGGVYERIFADGVRKGIDLAQDRLIDLNFCCGYETDFCEVDEVRGALFNLLEELEQGDEASESDPKEES